MIALVTCYYMPSHLLFKVESKNGYRFSMLVYLFWLYFAFPPEFFVHVVDTSH